MKKIFSILSLVLMLVCCNFALTSCGDDDEDETTEKNVNSKIIGTWESFDPQYPDILNKAHFRYIFYIHSMQTEHL